MRIVENLIKKRGLINISKKLKTKLYLNKFFLKRGYFYTLKYRSFFKNIFFLNRCVFTQQYVQQSKYFFLITPQPTNFFKTVVMFIV